MQNIIKRDEYLRRFIDRNYPEKSIIIADRVYEKYNLFALCIEQSQYFSDPCQGYYQ